MPDIDAQRVGISRYRQPRGSWGRAVRIIAVGLPVYGLLYIGNILVDRGVDIYSGTHSAVFLAVILTLVFLLVPASKKAACTAVPWYDIALLLTGLTGTVYMAFNYERVLRTGGAGITITEQVLGVLLVLVLLEAMRRTVGWPMIVVAGSFFLSTPNSPICFRASLMGQISRGRG